MTPRKSGLFRALCCLFVVGSVAAVPAARADFGFGDFTSVTGLNLVQDAHRSGGVLRLTPSGTGAAGAAWFATRQTVLGGFDTTFEFKISDWHSTKGADGFAFVVQNEDAMALGGGGGSIGYGGIANSVAVEFDTWDNSADWSDPGHNHVSIQTRGALPNSPDHTFSLGSRSSIINLSDAVPHPARVRYTPGAWQVFIGDLSSPVLTAAVDLGATLVLDAGRAWVGFTAATGLGYEKHDIHSWTFAELQPPAPQYFAGTGHCYEYVPAVGITWTEAKAAAEARSLFGVPGHLATVTSQEETDFIASVFGAYPWLGAWLGGRQEEGQPPNQGWHWVTGEPWGYTNWIPGEPNDTGGDERFLIIAGSGTPATTHWQWNDDAEATDPEQNSGYLVEYPIPEPATLALLTIGGLALIRRRKQPSR